jgi:hypothetical protein
MRRWLTRVLRLVRLNISLYLPITLGLFRTRCYAFRPAAPLHVRPAAERDSVD